MDLDEKLQLAWQHLVGHRPFLSIQEMCAVQEGVAEARELLKANLTPGWICESCNVFTGISKGATACRNCGTPRHGGGA
jgi:ribosomal protein L40E